MEITIRYTFVFSLNDKQIELTLDECWCLREKLNQLNLIEPTDTKLVPLEDIKTSSLFSTTGPTII